MVAAIGAVAAVGGSMISANGAKSAANQQAQSAENATAAQQAAAAQTRADLAPWTQQGVAANNALGYYLGLNSGVGGTSGGGASGAPRLTYDSLREQLQSQYFRGGEPPPENTDRMAQFTGYGTDPYSNPANWRQAITGTAQGDSGASTTGVYVGPGGGGYDEAGLDTEIRRRLAEQDAADKAAQTTAQSDPKYGSLLNAFHNGEEFDAGPAFSFTGKDLASEPGYQFGLNQGLQGIDRAQASRGNFLSGAAVKEATRYNEDYAGTKFNDAFNRASSTYGTNLTARQNEWNTNLNAYNGNRDRIYNFLTGVSTLGQNSAAQTGASNQQAATQAGNNMMAAGNAQAAGTVAAGNALQSGINGAVNSYRSASTNGLSGYDYGANGQSNPLNQSNLDSAMMRYQG